MTDTDGPPLAARLHHTIEGRTRLVIIGSPVAQDRLDRLAVVLRALPGVQSVDLRTTTGSIVLHHVGPFAPLAAAIEGAGLLALAAPAADEASPLAAALDGLGQAQRATLRILGGSGLHDLAFAGLVFAGVIQLARGQVAGPAITLFSQAAAVAQMRARRGGR